MSTGWPLKRLSDICDIDKAQGTHGALTYVGLEDVESNTARFTGTDDPRAVRSQTFRFSSKHVLYGRLRPYLNKVIAPDFDGHCSTEIFPLKPRAGLLREYLVYWLLAGETVDRINATCTGARMPRADMNKVMQFELPVPEIEEQGRIVSVLDEAFQGIDSMWVNTDNNRKNARALFDSELSEVSSRRGRGWFEKPLRELCDIKHGFAFRGEFFSDSGEYVLLTPGNFYENGGYRDRGEKQKYYTGEVPDGYVLGEGDLLVAMTEQAPGLLGSPIIVPESDRFLHNQRLGLVTGKPGVPWSNEFFFHVFNTAALRETVHRTASGVKVRHTSPSKIGDVVVPFPSTLREQQEVVSRLSELQDASRELGVRYERKQTALVALKAALLHAAFSGNV